MGVQKGCNKIYCDDRFTMYTNSKSYCTPETNTMLRQLYLQKTKNKTRWQAGFGQ